MKEGERRRGEAEAGEEEQSDPDNEIAQACVHLLSEYWHISPNECDHEPFRE